MMTNSSANSVSSSQAKESLPVVRTANDQYGFGSGFHFNYDPQNTQQSAWSRARYQYHGNPNMYHVPPLHALPNYAVPQAANDETSLSPYERLAFATELSMLYHKRRHHHYDNVFRLMMMAIILLSGFALVSGVDARSILGLSIIGIAAGSVIWNITNMSRLHDVLCSEYKNLMEMIRITPTPMDHDLRLWKTVRLRIRSKEPPIYWAIANECYYDVARSWDLTPRKRERLPVMLRPFMNWFRF